MTMPEIDSRIVRAAEGGLLVTIGAGPGRSSSDLLELVATIRVDTSSSGPRGCLHCPDPKGEDVNEQVIAMLTIRISDGSCCGLEAADAPLEQLEDGRSRRSERGAHRDVASAAEAQEARCVLPAAE
jgi:hypothetical protein